MHGCSVLWLLLSPFLCLGARGWFAICHSPHFYNEMRSGVATLLDLTLCLSMVDGREAQSNGQHHACPFSMSFKLTSSKLVYIKEERNPCLPVHISPSTDSLALLYLKATRGQILLRVYCFKFEVLRLSFIN